MSSRFSSRKCVGVRLTFRPVICFDLVLVWVTGGGEGSISGEKTMLYTVR